MLLLRQLDKPVWSAAAFSSRFHWGDVARLRAEPSIPDQPCCNRCTARLQQQVAQAWACHSQELFFDCVDRTAEQRVHCSSSYRHSLCCFSQPRLLRLPQLGAKCLEHIQAETLPRIAVSFMTSRQAKLQEDTFFRVMRILQENPDLTQRELAERLGISVGGLNYCLKALIEKGLVKMKNFTTSKNKFGYVYVLTPNGIAEKASITHQFLQRKMAEYEALKAEIEALKNETSAISLKEKSQ